MARVEELRLGKVETIYRSEDGFFLEYWDSLFTPLDEERTTKKRQKTKSQFFNEV